jgi:hypothetical protein
MKQIIEKDGVFAVYDEDEYSVKYLVPGKVYSWNDKENAPVFIRRLYSTRGQKAAWWSVSYNMERILNDSPYCPVVRGIVRTFQWGGPYDSFISQEVPWAAQRGSSSVNFVVSFWAPIDDPVRDYLAGLNGELCAEQGHLKLFAINDPPEDIREYVRPWNRFQPQSIFNHRVCGLYSRLLWRGIEGRAVGIFHAPQDIMILSEDHEEEPVLLMKGWYMYFHPFPMPRQPVD